MPPGGSRDGTIDLGESFTTCETAVGRAGMCAQYDDCLEQTADFLQRSALSDELFKLNQETGN